MKGSLKDEIERKIHRFFMNTWYNAQKGRSDNTELLNLSYEEYLLMIEKNKGLRQMAVFFFWVSVLLGLAAAVFLSYPALVGPQVTNLTIATTIVSVALATRGYYGSRVSYAISPQITHIAEGHDELSSALHAYPIWGNISTILPYDSPNLYPDGLEKEDYERGKFSEFWRLCVSTTLSQKGRLVPHLPDGKPDESSDEYLVLRSWYVAARLTGIIERNSIGRFMPQPDPEPS